MWIFIWVVLSFFVIGVFLWSTAILQKQKKSWAAAAGKLGLNYIPGKYADSPTITGIVKQYQVTFFTDSLRTTDARGRRFVTTIEVEMGGGMPTAAALATQSYAEFLSPLRMPQSWAAPGWEKSYIVKTRNSGILARYMTPERIKILSGLFAVKSAATLFFFDPQACVLRVEMPDPLLDAERLEKIARRIFGAADILMLTSAEREGFLAVVPVVAPEAPVAEAPVVVEVPVVTPEEKS